MPQLDSLLSLVTQQGANELRLGTDKAPAMFANGAAKKLTIPATSTETLRELFGELLDETKLSQLDRLGRLELTHQTKSGPFQITLTKRPGPAPGFDAIVLQCAPRPVASAPSAPAPPAPPRESPPQAWPRRNRRWPHAHRRGRPASKAASPGSSSAPW
jgi:twitching motility protein PilT